jgi:hypothetical protein
VSAFSYEIILIGVIYGSIAVRCQEAISLLSSLYEKVADQVRGIWLKLDAVTNPLGHISNGSTQIGNYVWDFAANSS